MSDKLVEVLRIGETSVFISGWTETLLWVAVVGAIWIGYRATRRDDE